MEADYFYIDTSALAKRYHTEEGSAVMDILFERLLSEKNKRIVTSLWSLGETISVLNRKKNEKGIKDDDFRKITASFLNDTISFSIVSVNDNLILSSLSYVLKHNLNSADALHLKSIVNVREIIKDFGGKVVLVASDKRLVRAAKLEGFEVIDPETETEDKVRDMLF